MTEVTIFTDGSSRGNPGPGGYGAVIRFIDRKGILHEKELSGGYEWTTNNRMELMAAIAALEALTRPCRVKLVSDSGYLVDAFHKKWIEHWIKDGWVRGKTGAVKNTDLWKRLLLAMEPHEVTFQWVRGHAGHPENERCDRLAVTAAQGECLPADPGMPPDDGTQEE